MMNTQNSYTQSALTLNELFRNFAPPRPATGWRWVEKDDSWTGELDLPGFTKEEVSLSVNKERALVVTAQQTAAPENEAHDFPRREVDHQLQLPREANAEKLAARLENGVLQVTLPKVTPDSKIERQIELN